MHMKKMPFSNNANAKSPSACTTQHSPDVEARGNGTKRGDTENNSRLHDAVLQVRVFGTEFEVFFE